MERRRVVYTRGTTGTHKRAVCRKRLRSEILGLTAFVLASWCLWRRDGSAGESGTDTRGHSDPGDFQAVRMSPVSEGDLAPSVLSLKTRETHLNETHFFAVCVVLKDADDLFAEFIARNHLAGVDHFVLYSDEDDLEFKAPSLLGSLQYLVSFRNPPIRRIGETGHARGFQMEAYMDCALYLRGISKWVSFIDVDEFFESTDQTLLNSNKVDDNFLRQTLSKYDHVPAFCSPWKFVLSNGRIAPAPCNATLSQSYPEYCTNMKLSFLQRGKFIAQVKWLDTISTELVDSNVHQGFGLRAPHENHDCDWSRIHHGNIPIAIVHYWSRSLIDFVAKASRGRVRRSVEKRTMFDFFARHYLCSGRAIDRSTALREANVWKYMNESDLFCKATRDSASMSAEQGISFVETDAALKVVVQNFFEKKDFDNDYYVRANNLTEKLQEKFLSPLERIPWMHFYLHGYKLGLPHKFIEL
jgi:hypothetical protein